MSATAQGWCERTETRPDGSEVTIPTRVTALEAGVERRLAADARGWCRADGAVVTVVCDRRTEAYAVPVEQALQGQGFVVHRHCAADEADGSPPAPTDEGALVVEKLLREKRASLAVSVGSGTINDRTKYAAELAGLPYLSYATAASMNGYNSPIVAIYVKGLKSSVPAAPPLGLYADPAVIAQAPRLMHLAGLGDLCSKPFAGADAAIAALLVDEQPWRLPTEMVEEVFAQALENGDAIGQDAPEAISQLMEALWVSGFSMTLAGTSAPASGGEHLWSHRIDMAQHDAGLPLRALHGTQVGIACELVRPLFGRLLSMSRASLQQHLDKTLTLVPDPADKLVFGAWLRGRHLDLSERSFMAMMPEASRKYNRVYRAQVRAGLVEKWDQIQAILTEAYQHAQRISLALQRAGAPRSPQEIGLSSEDASRILRVCRDIRNRFTILDLTAEIFGDEGLAG